MFHLNSLLNFKSVFASQQPLLQCVGGITVLSGSRGSNPSARTFLGWGLLWITGDYWLVHSFQSSMYGFTGIYILTQFLGGSNLKF